MVKNTLEREDALIAHLRARFEPQFSTYPELNTRWHITRFCRARNYDTKKTEKMLENYFAWRQRKNLKEICSMPLDVFMPLYNAHETGIYGMTYDGMPIVIERLGMSDINVFLDPANEQKREDYLLRLYEALFTVIFPIASAVKGRRVDQLFIIYDLTNVNISKFMDPSFQKFFKFMIATVQDYYPELLGKLFIVNGTMVMRSVYLMVKPWLDKKTKDKIELHTNAPLKLISKYVDVKQLPVFLGGQNTTSLKNNSGPWKEHLDRAMNEGQFVMQDRSAELEYFYTEDEREAARKRMVVQENGKNVRSERHNSLLGIADDVCSARDVRVMTSRLAAHQK